jgi:hypothetical protein
MKLKVWWKCVSLFSLCCLAAAGALATNAPSNLTATGVSSSAVSLTWTDNSSDEIGFTFAFDTNAAFTSATYVWTGGANTTSYTHSGRSPATTYYYKIKAEGNPDSSWTGVDSATTTPSNLAASASSSSQINVTWSGNAGNASIVGYTVAKATTSSFAGATYHYVNGANATSFSSTGLAAGTTYFYKVKAEGTSDAYDSPFTASVSAATSGAAPNPPSNLAATVVSSSRIDLTWTDNSTNETAFELKRATDSAFTQNVVWIGGIQGTSYSNTGLTASTTYYYKVRAKGTSQDSAYSSAVSATTLSDSLPNPPGNLTAAAISSSRVDLSWTDNSTNETGFELKRATDSAFTQNVVWIGGISGTAYSNVGLSPSTTYYYKVRAEGMAGKSAYSNTVSVTTPGSPPLTDGVPISPRLFGVNAWMPYRVGAAIKNGQLGSKWTDVQQSRARSMRYGGIAVDEADPAWVENDPTPPATLCPPDPSRQSTMKQYADMVDSMRNIGVEPILQVPVFADSSTPPTAQDAADIVRCINVTLQKGVKYWSIGNEPDLAYGWNTASEAGNIASYMRSFAAAMKLVDPTIKIVGPETAWYNWNVLNELTGGGSNDILGKVPQKNYYYLDLISFHIYGWPKKEADGTLTWPTRDQVIGNLASFDSNLAELTQRVSGRNSALGRTGDDALRIAVTEANINWQNPGNDNLDGVGGKSFLGGQYWAEMLGIAMQHGVDSLNFWSVIEGSNVSQDKGYLCTQQCSSPYHPSYHHFEMLAEHFRGNALLPADGVSFDNVTEVKTFAAKDVDQIAVILINQHASASYDYVVRLNGDAVSAPLKVNIPAGVVAQTTGTLANQSTILLVFDSAGALKKKIEYKRNPGSTPTLTEVSYP